MGFLIKYDITMKMIGSVLAMFITLSIVFILIWGIYGEYPEGALAKIKKLEERVILLEKEQSILINHRHTYYLGYSTGKVDND